MLGKRISNIVVFEFHFEIADGKRWASMLAADMFFEKCEMWWNWWLFSSQFFGSL